jgi:hypothetical protein
MVKKNFLAATDDIIWQKETNFHQAATDISFGLDHKTPNVNLINGYYLTYDKNGMLRTEFLSTTASIYSDEVLTRFQLRVTAPVPEPRNLLVWPHG